MPNIKEDFIQSAISGDSTTLTSIPSRDVFSNEGIVFSGAMDPSVINEEDEDDLGTGSSRHDSSADSGGSDSGDDVRIGENENSLVRRVQIAWILVLITVASAVSVAVFLYSRGREINDFETQFNVHADKIIADVMSTTERSLRAIEGFALQITIHALDHNQKWPNVWMTDFERRAKVTIALADAISLILIPLVTNETRLGWEHFSVDNQKWLADGLSVQTMEIRTDETESIEMLRETFGGDEGLRIPDKIFEVGEQGAAPVEGEGPWAPIWQFAPAFPVASMVNLNTLSQSTRQEEIDALQTMGTTIVGEGFDYVANPKMQGRGPVLNLFLNRGTESFANYSGGPVSDLYSPIFDNFDEDRRKMVGMISSYVYWQVFFENVLPDDVNGIFVVLENSCGQRFTYELNGPHAEYVGFGDLHDPSFDYLEVSTGFGGVFLQENPSEEDGHNGQCVVNIHLYPSEEMQSAYLTETPMLFTCVLVSTFFFTSLVFMWYQKLIDRRQSVVMKAAVQSTVVVQSLFPANVRERLFEENEQEKNPGKGDIKKYVGNMGAKEKAPAVVTSETIFGSKPIADLFANTTIMFADMVGFTAWASVREPTQVFTLLETTYHSFDMIAKRMRVFKVETIGDCYVAVAGLPTPRKDHAIVMTKFASSIRAKMDVLARELETTLGPDTADLGLRIGLHSGPVTAGVLRGDKGRFQLFGDTMNTASRMESTGVPGKIHMSRDTADLLIGAGKANWISPREGKVIAKGKGEMQTYFLTIRADSISTGSIQSEESSSRSGDNISANYGSRKQLNEDDLLKMSELENRNSEIEQKQIISNAKTNRLVQWNVDVLARLMKQIMARRSVCPTRNNRSSNRNGHVSAEKLRIKTKEGETVLDEVKDIIELPKFNVETFMRQREYDNVSVSPAVMDQLTELVTEVASMYRDNPFHNFEHASHVTMSVTKLLSRIVNPAEVTTIKPGTTTSDHQKIAADLHDHTFGITSDPLTQFACVFSALIHDLDHPGVTNAVLVQEDLPIAAKYKNKSIAEQNSVDLAWDLLMLPKFDALRCCIYGDNVELKRFRELVVNVVMATDIMDKDLGALRKARWEKAFRVGDRDAVQEDVNRKATIVIEHLIQASDVAHTMQHWHVFRKWNERLFFEMYRAYKDGRLDKDPSEFWYKGEMGFFDFYIVPLAKKLETCGVFGVSSDEYLNYALANRREWEEKGESIVEAYIESYENGEFC